MTLKRLDVHSRGTFVRRAVKEIPVTTRVIDKVMPYFPLECICIAGYLDVSDQYWKVNFHWDLLTYQIDRFIKSDEVEEKMIQAARAIRSALGTNPPDPITGYRKDKSVGATKDKSTDERIRARHRTMKQSKLDFERVLIASGMVNSSTKLNPPASEKMWWLSVAPVAAPGDSKHGTGYALDIAGNNVETARISTLLGASLSFNEASHVHVEWKDGVKIPI